MREEEFDGLRSKPRIPYRLAARRLMLPREALDVTVRLFQRSGRLETGCFWYGLTDDERLTDVVAAVVVPHQLQTWGNYSVPASAMRAVHSRVSPLGLRNLSQVHSHPGAMVEHSIYDDEMANSRKALSVVIPHYGRWAARWPMGIGVHEFQDGFWHLLSDLDAARRIVISETGKVEYIDCR
jgi:hypothetical protein